ncbi:MAG: hypothetical protein Tsb009_02990 [Planctomycetaceae bacterium]
MQVRQKKFLFTSGCLILLTGVSLAWAFWPKAEPLPSPQVETLLPTDAVVYLGWDGQDAHKKAFEKTAAYEVIYKTGLADIFTKLLTGLGNQVPGKHAGAMELLKKTYHKVNGKGLSLAISVEAGAGPPKPQLTLVLHDGADLQADISKAITKAVGNKLKFEEKEINGRTVTRTLIPAPVPFDLEFGWWSEGKHLVIALGGNAIQSAIDTARGQRANITTNPLWKKYRGGKTDFEVSTVGWFDLGKLRSYFGGMPIPAPGAQRGLTVNKVLKTLGLHNVGAIVTQAGYRERALWSQTTLEAPGKKTGLLALLDQPSISFDDLPPLPQHTNGFYACSIDWSKSYTQLLSLIKNVAKLGPENAAVQAEVLIDRIPAIAGFDPKPDLLDALGNVTCLYGDPGQGAFGMGAGVVIQVKDAKKLRNTLNDILQRVGDVAPQDQFKVVRAKKQGRELVTLEIARGAFTPTYAIDKNWMVIGLFPQTVEAFLLRVDGRLPSWAPSAEYRAALADLPKRFTSIVVSDPRATYRLLTGLAPVVTPWIRMGWRQAGLKGDFPISLADFPPAEVVTQKLFPNVTVCTVDNKGFHTVTRSSMPSIPLLGGGNSVATTAVMVALLLPAVQQAREAARRSTSKNNLKNIGLAMHIYHETFGHLPQGLRPNAKLKPEKRLSWMVSILPYIEASPLYERLDLKQAWDAGQNKRWIQTQISSYQNPGYGSKVKPGDTHYVGIAGVGKGVEFLKRHNRKTGIFGYDRVTRIRDIKDGTSNTMMISEASKNFGPWAAGGKATIRALTKKPYINGPDGIGGPFRGGCNVLFADGSVKFISEKIDSKLFEALSTVQGGEIVGDF